MSSKVQEALKEREKKKQEALKESEKKEQEKTEINYPSRFSSDNVKSAYQAYRDRNIGYDTSSYGDRINAAYEALKNCTTPTFTNPDTAKDEHREWLNSFLKDRQNIDALKKETEFYRDRLGDEKTEEILSYLGELKKGYDYYISYAGDELRYVLSDEYKAEAEKQAQLEEWQQMANSEQGAAGWEKYLADTEAKQKESSTPTWMEAILRGFTVANDNPVNMAFNNLVYDYRNDDSDARPTDKWTKDEQNIFGYLYASSPAEAFGYAKLINDNYNKASEEAALKGIMSSATSNGWSGFSLS